MKLPDKIPLVNTGLLPALISDYLAQKEGLKSLYKYTPALSSFGQIIADKEKDNTDRKLLTEVLNSRYADLAISPSVQNSLNLLQNENTFTVVAAHQPCLFIGPLFNIYKISAAISLAKQLKQAYPAYNFVPVYWMGSEDHDIDEVNNTYLFGKKIQWAGNDGGAVGRINSNVLKEAVQQLNDITPGNALIPLLEEGLLKHKTIGTFTQYLVNEVFKDYGLVVIDQDDARFKAKFAPIIEQEILNSVAVTQLTPSLNFLQNNYKVQATPRHINFFYLGEGYRERIIYDAEKQVFNINNRPVTFTVEEIRKELLEHPERFSPNVIYRPLYQETILPNLAFVGGAGELSYWLELKPLFDYYKVNYPALVMRSSGVILTPAVEAKLQKLKLNAIDFFTDVEQLVTQYVKDHTTEDTSLNEEKVKLEQLFTTITAKAEALDGTLVSSVAGEKQKMLNALENLENKFLKAEKRRQETAVSQIRSIHTAIFPQGILQERIENFLPYYSSAFIDEVIKSIDTMAPSLTLFSSQNHN